MNYAALFVDRVGVLATMHQKQQVMAPILEEALGIRLQVTSSLNTDQFGTFSRDIQRPGDQLTAARLKAAAALDLMGATLGFASEGSFGPHPFLPALAYNREVVILVDRSHDLEVVGEVVSTETNYRHQTVSSLNQAWEFAAQVGFPEHGLMVMTTAKPETAAGIIKGIQTAADLEAAVELLLQRSATGTVHLETDMRAHLNPTRMRAIAQATQDLIRKLNHRCPQCGWPNFSVVERRQGLPCGWCHLPTELVRSLVYGCQKCQFRQEILFPEGRQVADPCYCPYCNP